MSGPTSRGPSAVRQELRARVIDGLPPLVPALRGQWGDEAAFPPAGPDEGAREVTRDGTDVQTALSSNVDRWPLVQIELTGSAIRRGAIATTDGSDSIEYFVTYNVGVLVWVDVAAPEGVPDSEQREWATGVRDDLQMALRYLLLDAPVAMSPVQMRVKANTFREQFGEPNGVGGQRFEIGGRCSFELEAQERLTRPSLATVSGDEEIDVEVSVHPLPLIGHPANQ